MIVPRPPHDPQLAGWSEDAIKAMRDNPTYFVWWYTTKSMALVVAAVAAAYYYGKARGLEKKLVGRSRTPRS